MVTAGKLVEHSCLGATLFSEQALRSALLRCPRAARRRPRHPLPPTAACRRLPPPARPLPPTAAVSGRRRRAASGGRQAAGGGRRARRAGGGGWRRRAAAGGGRRRGQRWVVGRGNAKAFVSAKLAQKTRLMEAGNALRVCPAVTWLTVYRRLHMSQASGAEKK